MSELSPTATRTRASIITAAIGLLSARPEAPMTDVADAAEVSRSTLHRYFPDRGSLIDELNTYAADHWRRTVEGARLGEDTGLEAFRRLCLSLMDSLDILIWWMSRPEMWRGDSVSFGEDGAAAVLGRDGDAVMDDAEILNAIERGHRDGSIDPAVNPVWLLNVLWAVMHAAVFTSPESGLSAFDARTQAMRTLMKLASA
jgi:AcrR family transcriptional regulator